MNANRRLLGLLVFVAGATTVSTEMCASRILAPFFGASIRIYPAASHYVAGRLADRYPDRYAAAGGTG